MAQKNLKPKAEEKIGKKGYLPTGDEKEVYNQYKFRKNELINSRRSVGGLDIDEQMKKWDKQYFNRNAEIPASELDPEQTPVSINNAFGKVQSALGILIDRNPEVGLEENNPKFSASKELLKGLANASWKKTNSLGQLKLSIFNSAKRGWFVGRTYYRCLKHDARFLETIETDEKTGKETKKYETKEMTKVDDIQYMNMNNHNAWLDEQTVPEDFFSTRDWLWREVHHIDDLKKMFPEKEYPNMKLVHEGGDTREVIQGSSSSGSSASTGNSGKQSKKGMTEVYFYENQFDDWFIVEINGVMVVHEPLPQDHKRLSCVYGYWNLRNAESIYGIGVVEAMERDESLIDRIMNMDMRQLLATISPSGFYSGSEDPEDENLKYKPGTLHRTLDPKNISWLEIPQGNSSGIDKITWLESKEDSRTGITKQLEGDDSDGKGTAFEAGVSREAGLKRLRLPLKSIQYALEWEFRNRIDLIKQVYTGYHVEQLDDPEDIQNYLTEVGADPEFYFIENEGEGDKEIFYKKQHREAQVNVAQNESGQFIESDEKNFFHIKPEHLAFEGDVIVNATSILIQSEELEKADTLRMANMLIPLIMQGDPAKIGRAVKQMLLAFNKDPRKWLPDEWIEIMDNQGKIAGLKEKEEGAEEGQEQEQQGAEQQGVQSPELETVVPKSELDGSGKMGMGQRLSQAFGSTGAK